MPFLSRSYLRSLLLDLVASPSVSPSSDRENAVARRIADHLAALPYFQEHAEDLMLLPWEGDPLGRHLVFALVRSAEHRGDTVLLTGHMDVVDVKVCGPLAPLAFDAEAYTARIGEMPMDDDAARDLASGEWLFGRGVADMKCGVTGCIGVLAEASTRRESLHTNVAALFVPDEENSSGGMLAALPHLVRLQRERGLRYLACINTEPSIGMGDEELARVYTGSAGKINPFFLMVGCEAHLGEYYEGLNSAAVLGELLRLAEGNPDLADEGGGEAFTPFACMKHRDLRGEYSASIPERSVAYFSYFTAQKTPSQIVEVLRALALEAQKNALARHEEASVRFAARGKPRVHERRREPRVMTFEELMAKARDRGGPGVDALLEKIAREASGDERDRALAAADACVTLAGEKGPLVVVGFLMPWYPHRGNHGATVGDRAMLRLASRMVAEARERFGVAMGIRPFYEGISDLSYCGYPDAPETMEAYVRNVPAYGVDYRLPVEELLSLSIPVLNLGPIGKDAHKHTERIHEGYAFDIFPRLLRRAVDLVPAMYGEE